MTIKQWFETNFKAGEPKYEVKIDGMDSWGNQELVRAYFPADCDGSLFVLCGGQCIMAFETAAINKRPVYLVVEPSRYRNDGDSRDRLALHQSA